MFLLASDFSFCTPSASFPFPSSPSFSPRVSRRYPSLSPLLFRKCLWGHPRWVGIAYSETVMPAVLSAPCITFLCSLRTLSTMLLIFFFGNQEPSSRHLENGQWHIPNLADKYFERVTIKFQSFYSILVSSVVCSVLGSLQYPPVASANYVTFVWIPLWPSTTFEIPSLKAQVERKDILKRARESFTWKFLHYFATLRSRQHHCEIWLVYTWKIGDLDISCWHSGSSSPGDGERGWSARVAGL